MAIDANSLQKQGLAGSVQNPSADLAKTMVTGIGPAPASSGQKAIVPPQPITPTPQAQDWNALLRDPRVKTGLLQMGVNLLAGQGLGASLGGGLAAIGRGGQASIDAEEAARVANLDERAMRLRESTAVGRVSGGGSGGSGGRGGNEEDVPENFMSLEDFMKLIKDYESNLLPGQGVQLNPGQRIALYNTAAQIAATGTDPARFISDYFANPELAMNRAQLALSVMNGTAELPGPSAASEGTPSTPTSEESSSRTPAYTTPAGPFPPASDTLNRTPVDPTALSSLPPSLISNYRALILGGKSPAEARAQLSTFYPSTSVNLLTMLDP